MLLAMLCLLAALPVWAADVPAQTGLVTDTAGMLGGKTQVEQAAAGPDYTFHVLTVDSLNGEQPAVYAEKVYRAWGLTSRDVLLLIAKNERRTEMNFNNPELLARLDAKYRLGNQSIGQLVTETFNPEAQRGDFAAGTIAVMKAVHNLPTLQAVPSAPAPDRTARPTAAPGSVPSGTSGTQERSAAPLLALFAGVLVLAALVYLGVCLYKRSQLKRTAGQAQALLVDIARASEALKPFDGLVQGSTERIVRELDERLSALTIEASAFAGELTDNPPALLSLRALLRVNQEAADRLAGLTGRSQQAQQEIAHLTEVDKTVKAQVTGQADRRIRLRTETERIGREHGYPLTYLFGEFDRLEQEIARASDLAVFDPVEAQQVADKVQKDLDDRERDVKEFPRYLEALHTFPERAAATRQEVDGIIREHGLKLPHTDPFANLEKARAKVPPLEEALKAGQMDDARAVSSEIDSLLADAVEMTRRQAYLKEKNQTDIRFLEEKLAQYHRLAAERDAEWDRLRRTYAPSHWEPFWKEGQQAEERLLAAEAGLPVVRVLTNDEHQEFDRAREALDGMLAASDEADRTAKQREEAVRGWDRAVADAKRGLEQSEASFTAATRLIRTQNLRFHAGYPMEPAMQAIEALQKEARRQLATPPYRLEELARTMERLRTETDRFERTVRDVLAAKERAELLAREMNDRFRTVSGRVRGRVNTAGYQRHYATRMDAIHSLLAAGMYEKAQEEANAIRSLVSGMENEYRMAVSREQQSGGSNWGSGSGSSHGGGNSSGGSNWGSGGGGGSRNNNNNSSGGSNW
ncbi:hypothetical protein J31TS4_23830 [Paenibacillus sp. J31TS4]|nr:hypothetical protein J31TS4_23830 [Paenibacillus sp. J31TS4]